ncbi:lysosomal alpha-mannosidase [Culex quinquefasciatus]|nr:lysosomal alpha-mannosidase [Culex quinquefasciatus]
MKWWTATVGVFAVLASVTITATLARPGRGSGFVVDSRHHEHHWKHNLARKEAKCGYESCPVLSPNGDDVLNVHMVPHSHDDVGWLKTADQYYYGSKTNHQRAGVQYILDSVIQELLKDPARRFIQVESAFFFMWWDEQTEELKEQVRGLVQEGRLEFVGGAWSMNDEAAVHYQSVIDQFTWGLRLLNDTFGECGRPRAGWQIDPFGHSREQASLFAQMGYDGLFFARLDWNDKVKRLAEKKAEMIWKSSANLEGSDLFTSVLYNHYSAPPGFCFDVLCSDDPFVDGVDSVENNVKEKVDLFLTWVNNMATKYRSNNLILTFGDDFNYMDARMNYKNMDKLIKYVNARQAQGSKVNLFYSTPTCYLKALEEAKLTWPTKSDDFFPYASDPHSYWTGYFTSRPTSKYFERLGNHFLQVCKQLTALSPATQGEADQEHLNILREALGVMQHHDAITGTEKQHVADDYHRMLHTAIEACGANTNAALNSFTMTKESAKLRFESCRMLNISRCDVSESKENFVVTLYNPLGHASYEYVRLPVNGNSYVVRDHEGVELPVQMISIPEPVTDIQYRFSAATQELVFLANEIPPMGYRSYYVSEQYESTQFDQQDEVDDQPITIGNAHLSLSFDYNGFLAGITVAGKQHRLQQDFMFYEGAYGNNEVFENRSSGAYIFRPNGTERHAAKSVKLSVIKGDHVQEVHQVFNEWISQVIRVFADEQHVEFEWLVGPIPIEDGKGKEVITRFYTDIQSNGVFWTDSNGREMIKRVRDHRETFDFDGVEPVAGNYYPVTAKIALQDDNLRLAVLNDRAQGGTSMQDGVLELMVHRRLLRDDAFGVGEALNETAYGLGLVARGKHYLLFDTVKESKMVSVQARERFLQNQVLTPAWKFLSDASDFDFESWQSSFNNAFSALSGSLPLNVNLLTFEPWKQPHSYLIRFEHLLEKDEDPLYSLPVTIDIAQLFGSFKIANAKETTLAANQWLEDATRLKFTADPVPITEKVVESKLSEGLKITLKPMEIRTFVIEMQ